MTLIIFARCIVAGCGRDPKEKVVVGIEKPSVLIDLFDKAGKKSNIAPRSGERSDPIDWGDRRLGCTPELGGREIRTGVWALTENIDVK